MSTDAGEAARPAVTVLDGGLATALERRGHDLSDELWSARLLAEAPEEIVATHLDFFRSGARVATTASYQASFEGFARRGIGRALAAGLMRDSVRLAARARSTYVEEVRAAGGDLAPGDLLVAASVGPYGAMLADGSEYTGDYGVDDATLRAFHQERMEILVDAGADLLALETVPSVQEAIVLLDLLGGFPAGTSAWLSFSCADGHRTRRGDEVAAAFGLAAGNDRVVAVGVNCTAPHHVQELVVAAAEASGKPVVAYPNSGEAWDAQARAWLPGTGVGLDPADAVRWVEAGARWVGGCCRVSAAHIAPLTAALSAA